MYTSGLGVDQDYQAAFDLYKQAAEQGVIQAQFVVGDMYKSGLGTVQDETLAVFWFQKAAEKGHAFARFELAEALRYGRGVNQDKKEALKWYRKLANSGPEGLVTESMIKELRESVKEKGKDTGQQKEEGLPR